MTFLTVSLFLFIVVFVIHVIFKKTTKLTDKEIRNINNKWLTRLFYGAVFSAVFIVIYIDISE